MGSFTRKVAMKGEQSWVIIFVSDLYFQGESLIDVWKNSFSCNTDLKMTLILICSNYFSGVYFFLHRNCLFYPSILAHSYVTIREKGPLFIFTPVKEGSFKPSWEDICAEKSYSKFSTSTESETLYKWHNYK